MQLIQSLFINDYTLQFIMPDDKENMYYMPTPELNRFDLIQIIFSSKTECIKLFDDILQEAIPPFIRVLQILLSDNTRTYDIEPGEFGKIYNIDSYQELYAMPQNPLIWCYRENLAFIYKVKSTVYLEIAPIYPWLSSDPEDDPHYIPFEEYMKSYKPNIVIEVSHDTIQTWITQCKQVMEKVT